MPILRSGQWQNKKQIEQDEKAELERIEAVQRAEKKNEERKAVTYEDLLRN